MAAADAAATDANAATDATAAGENGDILECTLAIESDSIFSAYHVPAAATANTTTELPLLLTAEPAEQHLQSAERHERLKLQGHAGRRAGRRNASAAANVSTSHADDGNASHAVSAATDGCLPGLPLQPPGPYELRTSSSRRRSVRGRRSRPSRAEDPKRPDAETFWDRHYETVREQVAGDHRRWEYGVKEQKMINFICKNFASTICLRS